MIIFPFSLAAPGVGAPEAVFYIAFSNFAILSEWDLTTDSKTTTFSAIVSSIFSTRSFFARVCVWVAWHSRGQRFDPAYLHHTKGIRTPFQSQFGGVRYLVGAVSKLLKKQPLGTRKSLAVVVYLG